MHYPITVLVSSLLALAQVPNSHTSKEEKQIRLILKTYEKELQQNPKNVRLLGALGDAYYQIIDYRKAAYYYKQALALDPDNKEVSRNLGLAYLFTHQYEKSQVLLEKAQKEFPEDPNVLAALGKLKQVAYQYDAAEAYYLEALKIAPDNRTALNFLADLKMKQGKYREAADIYQQLLDDGYDWAKKPLELAKIGPQRDTVDDLIVEEQYDKAIEKSEELIQNHPNILALYVDLGHLYSKLGREADALRLYRDALELYPEAPEFYLEMGLVYFSQGQWEKSEKALKEARVLDPENATVVAALARIAALRGDASQADKLFQQAYNLNPYNPSVLEWYAEFKMSQSDYKQAQKLYLKLIEVEPLESWVRDKADLAKYGRVLDLIETKMQQKRYHTAENLYLQLISQAPDNEYFYLSLGELYNLQERYQDSIELYQQGLTHIPGNIALLNALGTAYLFSGEQNQAYEVFEQSLLQVKSNPNAMAGLGRVAVLEGNFDDAERYFDEALALDRNNFSAILYLGQLKLQQKKYKEAQRLFEQLLREYPKKTWVKYLIDEAKYAIILEQIQENLEDKNYDHAESLYLYLLSEAPGNASYYTGLGDLYIEQGEVKDAIQLFREGIEKNPDEVSLHLALAGALERADQLKESTDIYEQILKKNPENAKAWIGLAKVTEQVENYELAEKMYRRALLYDPGNVEALTQLGKLLIKQKKYEEANLIYLKLVRQLPKSPWVQYTLQDLKYAAQLERAHDLEDVEGVSEKQKISRLKTAEQIYRDVLIQAPNNPYYYLRLGLLYGETGRFYDAIEVYKRGLRVDPKNTALLNAMGFAYLYSNNLQKASDYFDQSLELQIENAEAWAGKGRVAELSDDADNAEEDYQRALSYDPENVNALSFMGALQMKQDHYTEAKSYYEKLRKLHPRARWVKQAIESVDVAPEIRQIRELEKGEAFEQAAEIYFGIISQVSDKEDYYLALGNLYIRAQRYLQAIQAFEEGVQQYPDSIQLRAALGIAYLLNKEPCRAKPVLESAYSDNPKNGEVLAGLGRVEALLGNPEEAERFYDEAIKVSPNNTTVLSFYGNLLMEERRYEEATQLYADLKKLEPKSAWVRHAYDRARDGSLVDSANLLVELDEFRHAECRFFNLIGSSSGVPEYYLLLGELYHSREYYDHAIEVFRQGLIVNPDSRELWRALAFAYMDRQSFICSCKIFLALLREDPYDAESWAGLARLHDLQGYPSMAAWEFYHSLDLSPDNITALTYMAEGLYDRERYFAAKNIYCKLMQLEPSQSWVRDSYRSACRMTLPLVSLRGRYHQENQWDDDIHHWVARYQEYGVKADLLYPINDCAWLYADASDEWYKLTDTEEDFLYYNFDVTRVHVGGRRFINPCYFIEGTVGASFYAPYETATFRQLRGVNPEATLLLQYRKPRIWGTFGVESETNLAARDFDSNKAKMVARYSVLGRWEQEVLRNMVWGVEARFSLYNDFVDNNSQLYWTWVEWTPPALHDLFRFRYHYLYDSFKDVIPDYYTYAPKQTHHLQVEFFKEWDNVGSILLGYAHGFQTTRTRFRQIIVTQPVIGPLFNRKEDYNMGWAEASYIQDCFDVAFRGDFYRDINRYSIWSTRLTIGCRF